MELNFEHKLNDQELHKIKQANALNCQIKTFNKIIHLNGRHYDPYSVTLRSAKRNLSFSLLGEIVVDTLNKFDQKHFASFFTGLNFPRLVFPGGGVGTEKLSHYHMLILLPKLGEPIRLLEKLFIKRFKTILKTQKDFYFSGIKPNFWKRGYDPTNDQFYKYCTRYESRQLENSIVKIDYHLSSFGFTFQNGGKSAKNFQLLERKFGKLENSSDEHLSVLANLHQIAMSGPDRRKGLRKYLDPAFNAQGTPAYLEEIRRAS
jgi:hypothetical protein